MSKTAPSDPVVSSSARSSAELFAVSALVLFLELACIRWLPAHVLFLTFFTNTVLLASFLGMSVGCLIAKHRRNYLAWTPAVLMVLLATAYAANYWRLRYESLLEVGRQATPQMVYFGTEYHAFDARQVSIPIELVCGFFFLLTAFAMLGPGQELGRALDRIPHRVKAYTLNISGSIVGIVLFAACAWWQLSPLWWFALIAVGLTYFLTRIPSAKLVAALPLLAVLALAMVTSGALPPVDAQYFWSPYYRIDYREGSKKIEVNLIGHQQMVSRQASAESNAPAYAMPYLFRRDAGRPAFEDVMIIGAGSGNDVSRALQWGARHVDAVEIDPVIQHLGVQHHPDRPYQDSRVSVHLDDGRNFLRSTDRKYDLIVYALVDSLVLHSSYSNIRLESYLFTTQALADVQRHLKPGGMFVMYNYFRQGWIVSRLQQSLSSVFGGEPLVLTLPYQQQIDPRTTAGFVVFLAGDTATLRDAFAQHPKYWLARADAPSPSSPNGFQLSPAASEVRRFEGFGLATVGREELRLANDEWPFLYLRRPMIPSLSLRGMAVMGSLALGFIWFFLPRAPGGRKKVRLDGRMFFLGAGFMLIETKAVVEMALLFGSTWMVNTIVFFAVLVMILGANLFVLRVRPQKLWPYYAGLLVVLALNVAIPLERFLGLTQTQRVVGSCALVFAPILFAGVIFAVSFSRSVRPDLDFGANIAGAMLGGLAENTSMLLGFKYLVLVAAVFYLASAAWSPRMAEADLPLTSEATAGSG